MELLQALLRPVEDLVGSVHSELVASTVVSDTTPPTSTIELCKCTRLRGD